MHSAPCSRSAPAFECFPLRPWLRIASIGWMILHSLRSETRVSSKAGPAIATGRRRRNKLCRVASVRPRRSSISDPLSLGAPGRQGLGVTRSQSEISVAKSGQGPLRRPITSACTACGPSHPACAACGTLAAKGCEQKGIFASERKGIFGRRNAFVAVAKTTGNRGVLKWFCVSVR